MARRAGIRQPSMAAKINVADATASVIWIGGRYLDQRGFQEAIDRQRCDQSDGQTNSQWKHSFQEHEFANLARPSRRWPSEFQSPECAGSPNAR